jgi:predicted Rossmann fold flavoprotein
VEKADIIIVGAGASGLMAAALLPRHYRVLLIDANSSIGMKLRVSGGGKCNITNKTVTPDAYLGDPRFIDSILRGFTSKDTLEFFQDVAVEERERGQIFGKESAKAFVKVLEKRTSHCQFECATAVEKVEKRGAVFYLFAGTKTFTCKTLVVASGGLSWPQIGASDVGHRIAHSFGHTVISPAPALVGMTVQKEQFWMKTLSGIAFPVRITCKDQSCEGNLLFSHKGISGPVMMDVSLFWQKGQICIDFLPAIDVKKMLTSNSRKLISSVIPLPKRFVKQFLEAITISDKPLNALSEAEKVTVAHLNRYSFAPAGTVGFSKAEATKGGVDTVEIDPLTLQSKKEKGLYFLGEVLDVTGRLGGYNLQWAFASAAQFARNLA